MPDEVKLLPCEELVTRTMENIRRCSPPQIVELLEESAAQLETYGMTLQAEVNRRAAELIRAIEATRPPIGTDEVVERVARAICWAMAEETDDCSSRCFKAGKCMADDVGSCFIRDARAAIAAMKDAASD